jgi:protein-S-isoprenylcysteine O-methyltransferase
MIKIQISRLVFTVASSVIIVIIGGGLDFIQRPLGAIYLALWLVWGLSIALLRQRGVISSYDNSQKVVGGILAAILVVLVIVPPWEYSHFVGPIPRDGFLAWSGLFLFALGIVVQSAAMWTLHGLFTGHLGIQPDHQLVTSGPYRFVRHPGYLGYLLCLTGIGLALSSIATLSIAILIVPILLWRIEKEEKMLAAELSGYQTYIQQTKRLIPLVY